MKRALTAALFLTAFGAAPACAQDAGVAAPTVEDDGPRRPRTRDAGTRRRRPRRSMDAGVVDAGPRAEPTPLASDPDGVEALDGGPTDAGPTERAPDAASADAAPSGTEMSDAALPDAAAAPAPNPLADLTSGDAGPADGGARDAEPSSPDAGMTEAAEPTPAAAPSQDVPWTTLLNELLFERAAREQRERPGRVAQPAPGPLTPTTVVNNPGDVDVNIVGCAARPELFGLGLPERRISAFGLLLLLGLALLALFVIDRLRRPLPERGLLPRALGVANLAARLAVVVILLMLTSRLLPAWLRPALLLTIAAVAVTVGFGAVWVVLPDVVAGIILLTERRLRPGLYLSGDGFRGTLERVSPRVTTLRAPDGTTLTVPNRTLVKSRIQSSNRRWHELEVELTAPAGYAAPRVRRAIEDAVLSSPHIPPSPALVVSRDPAYPDRWRVKTRLIDTRFVPDFEGQLLERVEDALAVDVEAEEASASAPADRVPADGAPAHSAPSDEA